MNSQVVAVLLFLYGLSCMALLGWYVATDLDRRKRLLGLVLMIMVSALCIQQFTPLKDRIPLGIDLKGGTSYLLELSPREGEEKISPDDVQQAISQIRRRVDAYGGKEASITPAAENRILVQIPALEETDLVATRAQLESVSKLEFRLVHPQSQYLAPQVQAGTALPPGGYALHENKEKDRDGKEYTEYLLIANRAAMTGEAVKSAYMQYGLEGFGIGIEFTGQGAKDFAKITTENVGNRFAIMLDNQVTSAPRINEPIKGGHCQITGDFTQEEARSVASTLENPLQVKPTIQSESHVSATLGSDSIKSGVLAAGAGLLGTLLFMVFYYRLAGIVAVVGLVVNTLMVLGGMAMFGFVLTLPGIAGVILAIGVAVDANVLIFERLREETALGKSLKPALEGAFNKALSAILDSNLTTLITTGILFYLATGPVKGFAVTLTIGVIASLFAALVCGRSLLTYMVDLGWMKSITMANFFGNTKIDFLKWRKITLTASLVACLAGIGLTVIKGKDALGVDFKGGDSVRIETDNKFTTEQIRGVLDGIGEGEASIQSEVEAGKEYKRITSEFGSSPKITEALQTAFPEMDVEGAAVQKMGPAVGEELAMSSGLALMLGLLGILVYVWLRFEFAFAMGAIVAVIHDVVLTLGILIIFGGELNLTVVGAILTVAGYSINDTIVIFDRIREHLRKGSKRSIKDLMNESLNETLQRTVLTGSTTLLPLLVLYFFGGDVLKDFSFTLIVGLFVGTYSSVFVASPIVLWWSRITGKDIREQVLASEEAAKPKPAPLAAN